MPSVSSGAKAIIIHDGRLLTIRKVDQEGVYYVLPGGSQRHGESLRDALERECGEEVGCRVVVGDLRFVRDYVGANHGFAADADKHVVELMFSCRLEDPSAAGVGPVPDSKQVGVEWLPVDRLEQYPFYPRALVPLLAEPASGAAVYLGDVN